jgi:8-oxo-dGTP pyrophosphatase MutT (NUDIX family)
MHWDEKLKPSLAQVPTLDSDPGSRLTSVLIPIGHNRLTGQDEILLTKRTMLVETHKGQVSFPGGNREPGDRDLLATALRESAEEIGTQETDMEVVGRLDVVQTRGNVFIYPWVARMAFPYPFRLNPAEVEKLLFLPLDTLLREGLRSFSVAVENLTIKSPGIEVDGELVWGATARMLQLLRDLLLE